MPTSSLLSQDRASPGQYFRELGDDIADVDETQDGLVYEDRFTGRSGQAFGALGRGGYVTGPGVGRERGLTQIELMPYAFMDTGMLFGSVRGFRSDDGFYGANMGLGYRQYIEPIDRIFGINFFHDYDNTTDSLFRQWGFGVESLGKWWDVRANAYFPYGERSRLLRTDLVTGSQRFAGHNLLFDLVNTFGTSLRGGDGEIGIPIPGRFTSRHDVRLFAGGYWYDSDATNQFAGWSGRIQGEPIPSLLLQLQVTNDSKFDTNVVFAATFSFGGYHQPDDEPRNQFTRMTTPVQRNYNVVVSRDQVLAPGVVAINPATNAPYFFDHVASYANPGGNGTVENPFQTIDQAVTVLPNEILFVHADSVFDGDIDGNGVADNTVTLLPNVRYLGEGVGIEHFVNVQGLGNVQLPRATAGILRPQLLNGVGDGVTLANDAEFSGFLVGNSAIPGSGPTGNGVFGNAVSNVTLNQNEFNFAGLAGMLFNNTVGRVDIFETRIFNPGGVALDVQGGTPQITFSGDDTPNSGDITNDGDIALRVEDTLIGSFVNLTNSDIINTNSAAQGIFLNNVAGAVTVGEATISDAGTFGIQILDSSGTFTFRSGIEIDNPADNAIQITNLANTGLVNFTSTGSVAISNRNASAINFFNDAGRIFFDGNVNIGQPVVDLNGDPVSDAAAINWQGNSGLVQFSGNITINASGGDAFALGNVVGNTGAFQTVSSNANNPTSVNITGGVNNIGIGTNGTGVGVNIANNTATSSVEFGNGVSIAGRINEGVRIVDNAGLVTFGGRTLISNAVFNSVDSAIDIFNNTGDILFETIEITNATSAGVDGYGAGINVVDNIASVSIQSNLNVTTTNGIAVFVDNVGDSVNGTGGFFVTDGEITATGLPAIDIEDSRYNVTFTEVNSANSTRDGIRLVNNVGIGSTFDFVITGLATTDNSGGTIVGANFDGILADTTGSVSLRNMLINTSGFDGVHSIANTQIQLINDTITNSLENGLIATDTQFVDVEDSLFAGNGGAGNNNFNQILLEVNEVDADLTTTEQDDYEWLLTNNDITSAVGGDAVLVRTNATAAGASVIFQQLGDIVRVGNTTIDKTVAGTHILWEGSVDALFGVVARNDDFEGNSFILTGSPNHTLGKIGIQFETTSIDVDDVANLRIFSNQITSTTGNNHTAIVVNTSGASFIQIDQESRASVGNIIDLNPGLTANFTFATGFDITTGPDSEVIIANSDVTLSSSLAEGIIFRDVQTRADIEISGNTFDFNNLAGFNAAIGVDFQSIRGGGFVFLSSVDRGGLNGANNVFTSNFTNQTAFNPDGAAVFRGGILINGELFGQP